MKQTLSVVTALCLSFVVGCGEEDSCNASDLSGSYLITYELVSYDISTPSCGEIENQIITFRAGESNIAGVCTVWNRKASDNNCSVDMDYSCKYQDLGTISNILEHDEMEPGGKTFDSTMTIRITDLFGNNICNGTYNAHGVRI